VIVGANTAEAHPVLATRIKRVHKLFGQRLIVPEQVRPIIENWRLVCNDSSPEALMFPTFGRGKRKGQPVVRHGKNFLTWRILPVARKLGISVASSPSRSCVGRSQPTCKGTQR
jgi:hypothetical protein